jgi:hypothetical protein
VVNDETQPYPYLQYTNRISEILQESCTGVYEERFPSLVSFVGQTGMSQVTIPPSTNTNDLLMPIMTGGGKSTVIDMLIKREQAGMRDEKEHLAPVPGLSGANIPTTGNVHLYADPGTYYTRKPMLFADCEGIAGGESIPLGLSSHKDRKIKRRLQKQLKWATGSKRSREYTVATLFPKILYTFSDVVVFILQEPK